MFLFPMDGHVTVVSRLRRRSKNSSTCDQTHGMTVIGTTGSIDLIYPGSTDDLWQEILLEIS